MCKVKKMLAFSSSTDLFWSCTGTEGRLSTDMKGVSGQFILRYYKKYTKRPIKVNKAMSVFSFSLGLFYPPRFAREAKPTLGCKGHPWKKVCRPEKFFVWKSHFLSRKRNSNFATSEHIVGAEQLTCLPTQLS